MRMAKDVKRIVRPEHLSQTAAQVIGLHNMGYETVDEILDHLVVDGQVVGGSRPRLKKFIERVLSARHEKIRLWVDVGLPTDFAVPLPSRNDSQNTVRCRLCNSLVCYVPCIQCAFRAEATSRESQSTEDRPIDSCATGAYPGTIKKIEVMRKRAERGRNIFHSRDCPLVGADQVVEWDR